MEDLFAPTTRLRDLYRAARERAHAVWATEEEIDALVELELITGSSVEDTFLHCGFTWSGFYSWARGKMVWLSPDVFFSLSGVYKGPQTEYRRFLSVRTKANDEEDTSQESKSLHVFARSEAHTTVASDILLQLLTTGDSRKVELSASDDDTNRFPISGLAFSYFLAQSRNLRNLSLGYFALDTCHCRAIDALARTDLEIELVNCKLTESGEDILLECIRQNRGPTELINCHIDTRRLAGAL
jgi:hypothetical protein